MKEVNYVANKKRTKRSREEVITQAACLVAGTINSSAMGLTDEQVNIEDFKKLFKEKATEMLEKQELIVLSIGPCINVDGNDNVYSNDMQAILDSIEGKMQTKFYFFYGLMLLISENELFANWLPH